MKPLEGASEPRGSVDVSSSSGGAIVPAALCVDVRHDPALEGVPAIEIDAIVDDSASEAVLRDAQWVTITNELPEPITAESEHDEAKKLAASMVLAANLRHSKNCPGRAPDGSVSMATAARLLPSEMQNEETVILATRPRARDPKPRYHAFVVDGKILRIAPIEGFSVSGVRVVQRERSKQTAKVACYGHDARHAHECN